MSITVGRSPPGPGGAGARPAGAAPTAVEFRYTQTDSFAGRRWRHGQPKHNGIHRALTFDRIVPVCLVRVGKLPQTHFPLSTVIAIH
jgi:hypothetical protein